MQLALRCAGGALEAKKKKHLALKQGHLTEFCRTVEMRVRAHGSVQLNRMEGSDKR